MEALIDGVTIHCLWIITDEAGQSVEICPYPNLERTAILFFGYVEADFSYRSASTYPCSGRRSAPVQDHPHTPKFLTDPHVGRLCESDTSTSSLGRWCQFRHDVASPRNT